MNANPIVLKTLHRNIAKLSDHGIDSFRTPLMGVVNAPPTEVIQHEIAAIHLGKLASNGKRTVDPFIHP
ncbi:MAG: hypothetical protein NWR51_06170 [Akkermansiaceae bacterium]|nr:hypothetical protein [Akkermansiaceae bacterium]